MGSFRAKKFLSGRVVPERMLVSALEIEEKNSTNLEAYIDICSIYLCRALARFREEKGDATYRWRPPKRETSIRNLVETRPLGIGEFLEFHRLLKAAVVEDEIVMPQVELVFIDSETGPVRSL